MPEKGILREGGCRGIHPHFAVSLEISKKLTVKRGILLSAYRTAKSFVFTHRVGTYVVQHEDLDLSWKPNF